MKSINFIISKIEMLIEKFPSIQIKYEFDYDKGADQGDETLPPQQQKLKVTLDRKQRKGKGKKPKIHLQ